MKTRFLPLTTLTLALALTPIAASAENDFGRPGPYVRGGVAAAWDLQSFFFDVDTGVGLGIAAGQRVGRWLALEGQYQWLGNSSVTGTSGEITRWDTTANVRLSTAGRFQPYALIGIGYGNYEASGPGGSVSFGGFVAQFGGGLDIYVTNHIALYAEAAYMLGTGDLDLAGDYATLGAGAMWRF